MGLRGEGGGGVGVVVVGVEGVGVVGGLPEANLGVLIGMRESVGEESEQAGGADVMERGCHQDGKDFLGDDSAANGGDEVVNGNGAFAEKLLHHFVVAFGDHLDEFFVSFL